jgi:hypothetical protein
MELAGSRSTGEFAGAVNTAVYWEGAARRIFTKPDGTIMPEFPGRTRPAMSEPVRGQSGSGEATGERRANDVLRALVTEMLERVRELDRHAAAWTAEERAQAEAELDAIMQRVRGEAAHRRD